MRINEMTKEQWAQLWASDDGKKFRVSLALMFVTSPPNTAPAETDYRAYWWELRDVFQRRRGVDQLVAGMEGASRVADKFRPSAGSVRAHARQWLEEQPDPSRALPAKPYAPPTAEQWAELAEIKARIMGRFDIENLDSKDTERKGA